MWTPLPPDGFAGDPTQVSTDSHRNVYATSSDTHLYRLKDGATSWELFDQGMAHAAIPIEASDRTVYTYGDDGMIRFRAPDDTAWTVTQNTTFGAMFADKSGNIWVEERGMPSRVLLRVNHATATPFTTRWLTHVIGIDRDTGFVLGGQSNYLAKNGLVESFDPATGAVSQLNDGSCASDVGAQVGICGDGPAAAGGGFVGAIALAPSGDVYELFAVNNGEVPSLLRLSTGQRVWHYEGSMLEVWNRGSGAVQLSIGPDGHLFAYTTYFSGQYNPNDGTYTGGEFTSYVYGD